MRPRQWLKNVVVFAPLVFSGAFLHVEAIAQSLLAFVVLCFLASAVYIANDVQDLEEDRRHPAKLHRPIAAGRISLLGAWLSVVILISIGLGIASLLGIFTVLAAGLFLVINGAYIFGAKKIAILDVMLIGASFVARVLVGAAALGVPASSWLLLTLFFLATYLGFTKRTAELRLSNEGTRASLKEYSLVFLDHARSATLAVTLALYTLYTFASPFGQGMAATVPFVFFGLLRYQAIVDGDLGQNDGPTHHVYEDRQIQMALALWATTVLGAIAFIS